MSPFHTNSHSVLVGYHYRIKMSIHMKDLAEEAVKLTLKIHAEDKRLAGDTYADHCIRVYKLLIKYGIKDQNTLIASLLHHAYKYIQKDREKFEDNFGKEPAEIVKKYDFISGIKLEKTAPAGFNEKYIIQAYLNLTEDIRPLVIRFADRIDNLDTVYLLEKNQRTDVANKCLYLYAPIARILGLSKIVTDLEDRAFKILLPGEYYRIGKIVAKQLEGTEPVMKDTVKFLNSILNESEIRAKINYRVKHLYGIYRKALYYKAINKYTGRNYEGIYDLVGMSIIVDTTEDCYKVEGILNELWENIPEERDDYINRPRELGYKAIHNVFYIKKDFPVEVQIKTFEMYTTNMDLHRIFYRSSEKTSEQFMKYTNKDPLWFKNLNYWRIEKSIKSNTLKTPFGKNVYVFTPKGDIIELPKGATVIDFAYAVHSDIGNRCSGAYVNGKIEKLDYIVNDGDCIKIKTAKNKKPSADWLKTAKTSRAKTIIRRELAGG